MDLKLGIITPFKNESETIGTLVDSILTQKNVDFYWLLINDGSTDNGESIVKAKISNHKNVNIIDRVGATQERKTGGNVVQLINDGIKYFSENNYKFDILLKIDADVELIDDNHFKFILDKFEKFPKLGIASGNVFHISTTGAKVFESKYKWKTQGQAKFYRKSCLEDIGGLKPFKGWDGIDDVMARNLGYITQKFFELEVKHMYETQTRSAEGGLFAGIKREVMGYRHRAYPFWFYTVKSSKLLFQRPYFIRAFYFLIFSIYANIKIEHKLDNKEVEMVRKHIKRQLFGTFDYVEE